jgi:hypothetical protein
MPKNQREWIIFLAGVFIGTVLTALSIGLK